MRHKGLFRWVTPLRFGITLCCFGVCVAAALFFVKSSTEMISAPETPIAAAPVIAKGYDVTVRINAPKADDLYGYQFRLEYDSASFAASKLKSLIGEIPTIFKKEFDGYILIGATMTGDSPGYSASDTQICELNLTALTDDGKLPEVNITSVSVVSAELDYTEDINGWVYELISDTRNG